MKVLFAIAIVALGLLVVLSGVSTARAEGLFGLVSDQIEAPAALPQAKNPSTVDFVNPTEDLPVLLWTAPTHDASTKDFNEEETSRKGTMVYRGQS